MTQSNERWLQRELQWRLTLPLLAIVALTGLLGAYAAQYYVERVFDRWLLDAANSLAEQVRFENGRAIVELSAQAQQMLTYDVIDRVYYDVAQDDHRVLGNAELPDHGSRQFAYASGVRAFDAMVQGRSLRVVRVPLRGAEGAEASVSIAETRIKRERAQRDLMVALSPLVLLVAAAAWVIGATVRGTLKPLERIAARWNERSHASLEPIATNDVPRELAPFAVALNDLLGRVRGTLERERQFAATAAHQLRTPLTGLQLGLARAASAGTMEEARIVLGGLSQATQRTARLVQQLLALSRLDPEMRAGFEFEEVDLVSLAGDVGEIYLDFAERRGVELELDCPEAAVRVRAHPDFMREALANLIDNALRYTPAGGRVVILVEADPPAVSVADSGPGIPEDERAQVFDRFVRGRAASAEGSGLGLAIVREIAILHGAQVSLDASELGGTRITLRFAPSEVTDG